MPYRIRVNVSNPGTQPVTTTIHAGTIFQVRNPFGRVQNLSVKSPRTVVVPPGGHQTVQVPVWCINHHFKPPHATPMSLTPLRTVNTYGSQGEAWADLDGKR
jgi:hypothetical protein